MHTRVPAKLLSHPKKRNKCLVGIEASKRGRLSKLLRFSPTLKNSFFFFLFFFFFVLRNMVGKKEKKKIRLIAGLFFFFKPRRG